MATGLYALSRPRFASLALALSQCAPDLTVTGLSVDANCHIVARVENAGQGSLPGTVTGVVIQFYRDGAPLAGSTITSTGLAAIRMPSGVTEFALPTFKVTTGMVIRVQVDPPNLVAESREDNNQLAARLSCVAQLPDLTIQSIGITPTCAKQLEVANVGTAPLLDAAYYGENSGIWRIVDGMPFLMLPLATIDPQKTLMTPGSTVVYSEPLAYRAYTDYTYDILYVWQEVSKINNSQSAAMPTRCTGTRPAFDLEAIDLSLNTQCRTAVTIRNNGPGPVPPVQVAMRFSKGGAPVGWWGIRFPSGLPAGGTSTDVGPSYQLTTPVIWSVAVDYVDEFPEGNESNNVISRSLHCPTN